MRLCPSASVSYTHLDVYKRQPDTLVIALSQSGETADTLAAARECKARGARLLAIVHVVGSSLAKLADDLIYTCLLYTSKSPSPASTAQVSTTTGPSRRTGA